MSLGKAPYGLDSLLRGVLRGLDLERRVKEQMCVLVWDDVVGEQVASAAQPVFAKDGQLFVVTSSPVWAQELTFYRADIIARLNSRVGGHVLKEMVLKSGRLPARRVPVSVTSAESPGLEGIQLDDLELEMVEEAVRTAGEEAAETVRSLVSSALRLEKWKKGRGWTPCRSCGALQHSASGVCPVCRIK